MRFLLLLSCTLSAQFFDLAVTDNGTVYFSTPLITGNEDYRQKIYKITGDNIELFVTGGGTDPFGPSAILPLTSGDGSIASYALYYPCTSGSCGLSGVPRTYFQFPGLTSNAFSGLQVARNGRFLLGSVFNLRLTLIELPSLSTRQFLDSYSGTGPQSVANNGAVLLRDSAQHLYIAPFGEFPRPIPGAERVGLASVSPNADRIVYDRSNELILTDPQGSDHRVLASFGYQPSFANDGTLLYLLPDGAMILPPGGEPRKLIDAAIQRAIISGDGQLAWLVTKSGQLLRVQTATGTVTEAVPETPFVSAQTYVLPGSVIRLNGTGISKRTKVQVDDVTFPIAEVTSKGGAAQVPWEFPSTEGRPRPLIIQGPGNPFLQRVDFYTADRPRINFERDYYSTPVLQAAHQDFHGKVTKEDPARPGETIHVYARNVGPVDQPIATGERSPISPPARVTTPMACYLQSPNRLQGIEVPFAGLAAASIGIYQIDVTIPLDWNESVTRLECTFDRFLGDTEPIEIATAAPQR